VPKRREQTEQEQKGISLCNEDVKELEGVGKETAAKLNSIGIYTVRDLAFATKTELKEAGIGEDTAARLIRQALRECGMLDVIPADTLAASQVTEQKLSTLVPSIDELFDGGLSVGNMYELIGEYGTGKTQLCFQLSIAATLEKERGGLDGSVLFMDTEGTFKVKRIEEMAKHRNLNPTDVLQKIYFARIYTPDHLELLLRTKVPELIKEKNVKLIVIDSLIKLYRSNMPGRENLAERQQRLNIVLSRLNTFAERFKLVVVYTNQIVANPVAFTTEPMRPAGGNIVAHAAQYRVELSKKGKVRMMRVIDSPDIPPDKVACFSITYAGIEDAACS
jgi:DNA repair protein RadA